MNETKHTPGPWAYGKTSREIYSTETGRHIATMHSGSVADVPEWINADADFIIRACNNHAALLAELAAMVEVFGHTPIGGGLMSDLERRKWIPMARVRIEAAQQAITKATGNYCPRRRGES